MGDLTLEDDLHDPAFERRRCVSLPFISPKDFQANVMAENLAEVIKEVLFFQRIYQVLRHQELYSVLCGPFNAIESIWQSQICVAIFFFLGLL